jgi:hypothetical protein
VLVVAKWIADGLTHGFTASEMDHGVEALLAKYTPQQREIPDVALHDARRFACQLLQTRQYLSGTVAQVVENGDLITLLEQVQTGMRAEVAGTASHEDVHRPSLPSNQRPSTAGWSM